MYKLNGVEKLLNTMKKLRDPDHGCPWDIKQTNLSLIPFFKEELAEFIETIQSSNIDYLKVNEELGDILFQIIFHCQILEEKNITSFNQLCDDCATKFINRHPHVFDTNHKKFTSAEEVSDSWETIKLSLTNANEDKLVFPFKSKPFLDPLEESSYIGNKSAKLNFDWQNSEEVWQKVVEEFNELKEAKQSQSKKQIIDESGDLIFSLSQWLRHQGLSASEALYGANIKFIKRLKWAINKSKNSSNDFSTLSPEQMNHLWGEAKENCH